MADRIVILRPDASCSRARRRELSAAGPAGPVGGTVALRRPTGLDTAALSRRGPGAPATEDRRPVVTGWRRARASARAHGRPGHVRSPSATPPLTDLVDRPVARGGLPGGRGVPTGGEGRGPSERRERRRTDPGRARSAAAGAPVMRPFARPDRGRDLHDPAPRRDAPARAGHPGPLPPLLLEGARGVATGTTPAVRFLRARHPGAGRDVHRHGLARHRHRLRAGLRRAQATGLDPSRAPPPARGQDHHDRRRRGRPGRRAASRSASASGGTPRAARAPADLGARSARPARPPWPSPASASCWPAALRAEVNLAAANGLYLILLLLGGMIVPIAKLPGGLAAFAGSCRPRRCPTALHATLGHGLPSRARPGSCWPCGPWRRRWRPPLSFRWE